VVEIEAEMEDRHPHDGYTTQRIEAVETFGPGGQELLHSVFS
jgi:hypothetical protein